MAFALSFGLLPSAGCRKTPVPAVVEIDAAPPSASALPSIACDRSCRLRVLAPLRRGDGYAMAVDGKHVYLVTAQAASVSRVSIEGGPKTVLVPPETTKELRPAAQLALSETDVYWTRDFSRIFKIAKEGGTPTESAQNESRVVHDLTTSGGELWWTTFTDPSKSFTSLDWQVHKLSAGGAVAVGKRLKELSLQTALDATSAIFLDGEAHVLFEVPRANGERIVLARGIRGDAMLVGRDDKSVFLLEGSELTRFSRGTKSERTVVATVPEGEKVQACVVDANDVWIERAHSLLRVPKSGGTPAVHEDWTPNWAGTIRPVTDASAIYLDLRAGTGATATRVLVRVPK
ncbi:MAG: hypothetical protein ACXWP4_07395 [Polyangiales bacterium]